MCAVSTDQCLKLCCNSAFGSGLLGQLSCCPVSLHSRHCLLSYLTGFVSFYWATVCKTVRPMLSVRCLYVVCLYCPVCDVGVLWPSGWTDQDETWHAGRPRAWPHCFRWGPSSPSPKGAHPPIFGRYLLRPNNCTDRDVTWYGARPRPR